MRRFLFVLYMALLLGANAWTGAALAEDAAALREGDMKKLAIHNVPVALPEVELVTMDDAPVTLGDYHGQWVVLNFWATWCAPCRTEMPTLGALQAEMPEIAVIPVATGRNPVESIRRFLDDIDESDLTILRDPKSHLAREMGVMALPITVILDPAGREVARLIGDADWNSDSARAVIGALAAAG